MELVVIAGNASKGLAEKVCQALHLEEGKAEVGRFSDGEVKVSLPNVRGKHVVIIQSTPPPAENWIEMLLMADAARSGSAEKITLFMPYMGYSRQDRKDKPHRPISARAMIRALEAMKIDRLMTIDLHAPQIQGFTLLPFDNLYFTFNLFKCFRKIVGEKEIVLVSPDAGGVSRIRPIADRLNLPIAFIDKRRPAPNESQVMHVVGAEKVKGRNVIILDDIIDTAQTLVKSAAALKEHGAEKIYAAATHALLSQNSETKEDAVSCLESSLIEMVLVSDSISIPKAKLFGKLKIISCASLAAEAIRRVHNNEPLSPLFEDSLFFEDLAL